MTEQQAEGILIQLEIITKLLARMMGLQCEEFGIMYDEIGNLPGTKLHENWLKILDEAELEME